MKNYLNTLLSEKGISQERVLEVEGPEYGTNFIPVGCVVEYILTSGSENQKQVRNTLTKMP